MQSHIGIRCDANRNLFRVGGRTDSVDCRAQRRFEHPRLQSELHFSGDDARDIEKIVDQLRLRACALHDRIERALHRPFAQSAELEHRRPAENRRHRRAQFMRKDREKIILRAIGAFELAIKPGVVDCQSRTTSEVFRNDNLGIIESSVAVHAHERHRAEDAAARDERNDDRVRVFDLEQLRFAAGDRPIEFRLQMNCRVSNDAPLSREFIDEIDHTLIGESNREIGERRERVLVIE